MLFVSLYLYVNYNAAHREQFQGNTYLQIKDKFHSITGNEVLAGGWSCSYTLSLTSTLDRVGGQRHAPAALPPEKRPGTHHTHRRVGGPQGQSGRVRKISPPPGFDPRTVQPVASRYTD